MTSIKQELRHKSTVLSIPDLNRNIRRARAAYKKLSLPLVIEESDRLHKVLFDPLARKITERRYYDAA